jgi:hypothetical protein
LTPKLVMGMIQDMAEMKERINALASGSMGVGPVTADEIQTFLNGASTREIEYFMSRIRMGDNSPWFHRANIALSIRLSEDQIESASKIIRHTETLTQQTDKLLIESSNLSYLTKWLIGLTIALGIFALIQIGLMIVDIFKIKV